MDTEEQIKRMTDEIIALSGIIDTQFTKIVELTDIIERLDDRIMALEYNQSSETY